MQRTSLLSVFSAFTVQSCSVGVGKKLSGRDDGLEKILETSSLEMDCLAEGVSKGHGPAAAASGGRCMKMSGTV